MLIKTIDLNNTFIGYTGLIFGISYDPATDLIYCSLANGKGFRTIDKNGNVVAGWQGNGSVSSGMQFIGDSIYVVDTYTKDYQSGTNATQSQLLHTVTVYDRNNPSVVKSVFSTPDAFPLTYRFTGFTIDNNGYRYFLGYDRVTGNNSTLYITDSSGTFIKSISLSSIRGANGLNIDASGRLVISNSITGQTYFLNPIF